MAHPYQVIETEFEKTISVYIDASMYFDRHHPNPYPNYSVKIEEPVIDTKGHCTDMLYDGLPEIAVGIFVDDMY